MTTLRGGAKIHVGDLEEAFDGIVEEFKSITTDIMRSNVDSAFEYSWLDRGGLLESPDTNMGKVRGGATANQNMVSQIRDLYIEAWNEKYERLQEKFKNKRSGYKTSQDWIKTKKRWAKEGRDSPWNSSKSILPSGDVTWGIMTGWLKESVAEAFRGNSQGDFMKIDNLAIRGVWENNLRDHPADSPYVQRITKYYVKELKILESEEKLTELSRSNLQSIGEKMLQLIKPNFVEPYVEELNKLNIHIPGPSKGQ